MMMDGISTMKEVPFLQHVAPISLDATGGESKSDAATTSSSSSGLRHYKVVTTDGSTTSTNNVPRGAFGLIFCESSSINNNNTAEEGDGNMTMMASELTSSLGEYNKISNISSKSADEELPTIITDDGKTTTRIL